MNIGDIRGMRHNFGTSCFSDVMSRLLQNIGAASADHYRCALAAKRLRRRSANPLTAASDNGDFAFEPQVHALLVRAVAPRPTKAALGH